MRASLLKPITWIAADGVNFGRPAHDIAKMNDSMIMMFFFVLLLGW